MSKDSAQPHAHDALETALDKAFVYAERRRQEHLGYGGAMALSHLGALNTEISRLRREGQNAMADLFEAMRGEQGGDQ